MELQHYPKTPHAHGAGISLFLHLKSDKIAVLLLGRLMVGQRTLNPFILVRIQTQQPLSAP